MMSHTHQHDRLVPLLSESSITSWGDPTDEDTIYLNHRTWRNHSSAVLEASALLAFLMLEGSMNATGGEKNNHQSHLSVNTVS